MIGGRIISWHPPEPSKAAAEAQLLENARSQLRRGFLMLAVLASLTTARHGYELGETLADRGIEIERTTLYPLLRRLESQGLLASEWGVQNNRRRRVYRLTPDGQRILEQLRAEWRRLDLSLNRFAQRPRYEAA